MNYKKIILFLIIFSAFHIQAFAVFDSAKGGRVKPESESSGSSTENASSGAQVYKVEGKASLTKAGNPVEKELESGDAIEAGDSIYTSEGASVSIRFDEENLNTVTIPAGSEAQFTSIDPVSVRLKNGSVFSSVENLGEGKSWEVVTPVAAAAVRGTEFEVEYSAATGEFGTSTYDDENEKKSSAVELRPAAGGEAVKVVEGRHFAFKQGQAFSPQLVQKMSPERMQRGRKFKKEIAAERKRIAELKPKRPEQNSNGMPPGGPNNPNGNGGAVQPGQNQNMNLLQQNGGFSPDGHPLPNQSDELRKPPFLKFGEAPSPAPQKIPNVNNPQMPDGKMDIPGDPNQVIRKPGQPNQAFSPLNLQPVPVQQEGSQSPAGAGPASVPKPVKRPPPAKRLN